MVSERGYEIIWLSINDIFLQILWTLIMKFRDFIFRYMFCFIGNILWLLNSNFEKEITEWLLCWTWNSCLLLGLKMTIMYYNNKKIAIMFHLWRKIPNYVSFSSWNGMKMHQWKAKSSSVVCILHELFEKRLSACTFAA